MKSAACLRPLRFSAIPYNALSYTVGQSRAIRTRASGSHPSSSTKWNEIDVWDELRTAAGTKKKTQLIKWTSTHRTKPLEHGTRKPSIASRTHANPVGKHTAQQAKKARPQQVERIPKPQPDKSPAASSSTEWTSTDVWDEMRIAAGTKKKAQPKTWASTHGAKPFEHGRRKSGTRATHAHVNPVWRLTSYQQAKEARLQELEHGLEAYNYKSPVGPPHLAGSNFLSPLSKPSTSSLSTETKGESSKGKARLKPPSLAYTGDFDEACDLLSCLGPGPMGLDLEWNVSPIGGSLRTALLQTCSPSLVLILHLSAMKHRIPPPLKSILEDPKIIKTGVAILNDSRKLQREFGIDTRNIVELSKLVKLAQPELWAERKTLISLRDLTRIYLGRRLGKGAVRVSDWEAYPLAEDQIQYAASDTFVGLELLRAVAEYFKPSPTQHQGETGWILERLDMLTSDKATDNGAMELEEALKMSSYDLAQERNLDAAKKQKAATRTALREIQPTAAAKQKSSAQTALSDIQPTVTTGQTSITKITAKKKDKAESDDEVQVTRVLLAHERAMQSWLYSRQSFSEIASARNIKVATVANYVVRAMFEAKYARPKDGAGLLGDFSAADKARLELEINEVDDKSHAIRKRFRVLANSPGWKDASSSGESESESESDGGGRKAKAKAAAGKQSISPPKVAQRGKDKAMPKPPIDKWTDVDVVETSR